MRWETVRASVGRAKAHKKERGIGHSCLLLPLTRPGAVVFIFAGDNIIVQVHYAQGELKEKR